MASMSAVAASSLAFTAAVVPRAVRARTSTVVRAAGRARVTVTSAVDKVAPKDVKDHLDRGFVLVDIRDPEECAETGYKFSWKNIVVRTRTGGPIVSSAHASLLTHSRHRKKTAPRTRGCLSALRFPPMRIVSRSSWRLRDSCRSVDRRHPDHDR